MQKKYTKIDWGKTLLMLLPPLLRKPKQVTWLKVLLKPLDNLYDDTLYKMQHNGQVMYLEKVLNDIFNPGARYFYSDSINTKMAKGLIVIEDAHRPRVQYLYTNEEIYQEGYDPIVVANNGEALENEVRYRNFLYLSGASDFDSVEFFNFRVLIPSNLLVSFEKYQEVLLCLQAGLDSDKITEEEQVVQVQELNDMLIIAKNEAVSDHPDSIKIVSPKFHKVLNYYKLAGKSYETRKYSFDNEQTSLQAVRKGKERNQELKKYMYIR